MKKIILIVLIILFVLSYKIFITNKTQNELKIYNWAKYIGKDTIKNFEKEFNCRVIYDNYSSNEEMISKIKSGANYDIVFPTDYAVDIMKKANLLEPLNYKIINKLKNIDPKFLNLSQDPNNKYTVPYHWGNCGIAYNSKKINNPKSYNLLWDKKFKKRVAVPEDPRFVIGMILKYLGKSVNSIEKKDLEESKKLLFDLKENLLSFSSFNEKMLLSGEIDIVYGYSSGLIQLINQNPEYKYFIPEEGTLLWFDSMAITKNSENKELANKFINYILRPNVISEISNEIYAANPNIASKSLLDKNLLNNKLIYLDAKTMKKAEFVKDLGKNNDIFMNLWLSVKAN